MFRRGDWVLVGVSGGPDSTALLCALVALSPEFKLHLRAVYLNHGLRPAAAKREAAFVRELGKRLGVPVTVLFRKVRKKTGESPESAARRVRYQELLRLAGRFRCGVIALGHTADDQAETVLLWLLRGAGTAGLAGIPPVRKEGRIRIVRPLIGSSRALVNAYLKGQGIRPLLDESNRSPKFIRNRIRHQLIRTIEREYSPKFREHLATLAEIARADLEFLQESARRWLKTNGRVGSDSLRLKRPSLEKISRGLRRAVLRGAVDRLLPGCPGFAFRHWALLEGMILSGRPAACDLPHGVRAEWGGEWIRLKRVSLSARRDSGKLVL